VARSKLLLKAERGSGSEDEGAYCPSPRCLPAARSRGPAPLWGRRRAGARGPQPWMGAADGSGVRRRRSQRQRLGRCRGVMRRLEAVTGSDVPATAPGAGRWWMKGWARCVLERKAPRCSCWLDHENFRLRGAERCHGVSTASHPITVRQLARLGCFDGHWCWWWGISAWVRERPPPGKKTAALASTAAQIDHNYAPVDSRRRPAGTTATRRAEQWRPRCAPRISGCAEICGMTTAVQH